jgi:hypothetical protein
MTRHGEVFYVNFEKAFRLLLKACELDEVATRSSVKVALTVDGADLFRFSEGEPMSQLGSKSQMNAVSIQ